MQQAECEPAGNWERRITGQPYGKRLAIMGIQNNDHTCTRAIFNHKSSPVVQNTSFRITSLQGSSSAP
jgi:hypothetical protein